MLTDCEIGVLIAPRSIEQFAKPYERLDEAVFRTSKPPQVAIAMIAK